MKSLNIDIIFPWEIGLVIAVCSLIIIISGVILFFRKTI